MHEIGIANVPVTGIRIDGCEMIWLAFICALEPANYDEERDYG